jgi:nitric oxide reductase NorQ protein
MNARTLDPAHHLIEKEPYYEAVGDEIQLFEAAWRQQIPVLLKGPTGCGKTRFMEHMAWRLKRPLITVSCHDDLTASDLVGRYLVKGGETVWVDGPLTRAVRAGGICYLDEVVEARKDTMVVIHPLADDRRTLPMEKLGQIVEAPPEFCLAISYNPGYQSVLRTANSHPAALRRPRIRLPVGARSSAHRRHRIRRAGRGCFWCASRR